MDTPWYSATSDFHMFIPAAHGARIGLADREQVARKRRLKRGIRGNVRPLSVSLELTVADQRKWRSGRRAVPCRRSGDSARGVGRRLRDARSLTGTHLSRFRAGHLGDAGGDTPAGVGCPKEEVERIVEAAVASIPEPAPGITVADVERRARGVVAPFRPGSPPSTVSQEARLR